MRWSLAVYVVVAVIVAQVQVHAPFTHYKQLTEKCNSSRTTPRSYKRAAVVTNSDTCTTVGLEILNDDGSAIDAAIAALLCEGITNPQSMGIGGGFLMTIYDASSKRVEVLNAREAAPHCATAGMFAACSANTIGTGGLAVAIPGEVMGYWEAHQRYGRMGWYDLFRPAIDLATHGVRVTRYTSEMIGKMHDEILASPSIKDMLTNPETGRLVQEGDLLRRGNLATTLKHIARHGPQAFYNGTLTADLIYDVREHGGVLSVDDLAAYRAVWQAPVNYTIGDYTFYAPWAPGSGELLMYIVEAMAAKLCNLDASFWQRLIETWKFAFGVRAGMSGGAMPPPPNAHHKLDPSVVTRILEHVSEECTSNSARDYLPRHQRDLPLAVEDHGTSHICVYAPNGDAVSVTSTINLPFGALFVSESTGIILNNEMMDFAVPHHAHFRTAANRIAPLTYPMSSMVPTIVTDAEGAARVRLVIGAAGGFKIITATSLVILQHLYMEKTLADAIAAPRVHHQLKPMLVEYEDGFDEETLVTLSRIGHVLQSLDGLGHAGNSGTTTYSCVNAISIVGDRIYAVGDPRRNAYGGGL